MLELVKDRDTLAGDGSKTEFDFDFYIQKDTDIEVYIIDNDTRAKGEKLTLGTDYTVENISTTNPGFTVPFVSYTPTSDESVFAIRKMPFTQLLNLGVVTDYDERKIVSALDKLTALSQQNAQDINRCVKTPDESDTTGLEFPATLTANKAVIINADGDGLTLSEIDVDDMADYLAEAEAAATLAQATTGAVPSATGNGLSYLRQKNTEDGLEYRTPAQVLSDINAMPADTNTGFKEYGLVPSYVDADSISISAGQCWADDNSTQLVLDSNTQLDISSPSADTTYHIFLGLNGSGNEILEEDTNADGSGLSTIVGAKKRVFSLLTDGSGNIIDFIAHELSGGGIEVRYATPITDVSTSSLTEAWTAISVSAPSGITVTGQYVGNYQNGNVNAGMQFKATDEDDYSGAIAHQILQGNNITNGDSAYFELKTINSQIEYNTDDVTVILFTLTTFGYKDERIA